MFHQRYSIVLLLWILFSLSFIGFSNTQQGDFEVCSTPMGSPGSCIPIRSCRPLIQMLIRERPRLSQRTREYLRLSACGYDEYDQTMVCCPPVRRPAPPPAAPRPPQMQPVRPPAETRPKVTTPSGDVIDFSRHPKRGLLPGGMYCGSGLDDKIVRGVKAELGQFPWMARLGYKGSSSEAVSFQCGGSLINDIYVLTAAHCLVELGDRKLVLIRLGDLDSRTNPDCDPKEIPYCAPVQDFHARQIIVHKSYSKAVKDNDIALVRLNRKATFNELVLPVCLPFSKSLQGKDFVNSNLFIAGWGATEHDSSSDTLQMATVPIVSNLECQRRYDAFKSKIIIFTSQICAGGFRTTDSCGGDSGGPLMHVTQDGGLPRTIQIGIVSFGPRACGNDERPGVYTKVDQFLAWILANLTP